MLATIRPPSEPAFSASANRQANTTSEIFLAFGSPLEVASTPNGTRTKPPNPTPDSGVVGSRRRTPRFEPTQTPAESTEKEDGFISGSLQGKYAAKAATE